MPDRGSTCSESDRNREFEAGPIGLLAGVINGIGVALQILLPKFFAKNYERDTLLVYGFLGGAFVLAFGMKPQATIAHLTQTPVLNLIVDLFGIGILCTMVANVACVKSTQYVEATTTSILSALEVVVGDVSRIYCLS